MSTQSRRDLLSDAALLAAGGVVGVVGTRAYDALSGPRPFELESLPVQNVDAEERILHVAVVEDGAARVWRTLTLSGGEAATLRGLASEPGRYGVTAKTDAQDGWAVVDPATLADCPDTVSVQVVDGAAEVGYAIGCDDGVF